MFTPRHLFPGEFAKGSATYTGHHRMPVPMPVEYTGELQYVKNPLGYSLGSRLDAKPKYGVTFTTEEELSNDANIRRF